MPWIFNLFVFRYFYLGHIKTWHF